MRLCKNVSALSLVLIGFFNMAQADEATQSNRYNYARSELIRLEDYCGVTPMVVHHNFQMAPRVSMANFISEEEIVQFENRIAQLQNCVPQKPSINPFCRKSKEKLMNVPQERLEMVIDRYTQIGIKTTINLGSAPGFFDITAEGGTQQLPKGVICY